MDVACEPSYVDFGGSENGEDAAIAMFDSAAGVGGEAEADFRDLDDGGRPIDMVAVGAPPTAGGGVVRWRGSGWRDSRVRVRGGLGSHRDGWADGDARMPDDVDAAYRWGGMEGRGFAGDVAPFVDDGAGEEMTELAGSPSSDDAAGSDDEDTDARAGAARTGGGTGGVASVGGDGGEEGMVLRDVEELDASELGATVRAVRDLTADEDGTASVVAHPHGCSLLQALGTALVARAPELHAARADAALAVANISAVAGGRRWLVAQHVECGAVVAALLGVLNEDGAELDAPVAGGDADHGAGPEEDAALSLRSAAALAVSNLLCERPVLVRFLALEAAAAPMPAGAARAAAAGREQGGARVERGPRAAGKSSGALVAGGAAEGRRDAAEGAGGDRGPIAGLARALACFPSHAAVRRAPSPAIRAVIPLCHQSRPPCPPPIGADARWARRGQVNAATAVGNITRRAAGRAALVASDWAFDLCEDLFEMADSGAPAPAPPRGRPGPVGPPRDWPSLQARLGVSCTPPSLQTSLGPDGPRNRRARRSGGRGADGAVQPRGALARACAPLRAPRAARARFGPHLPPRPVACGAGPPRP
jgi:hypothetical protein